MAECHFSAISVCIRVGKNRKKTTTLILGPQNPNVVPSIPWNGEGSGHQKVKGTDNNGNSSNDEDNSNDDYDINNNNNNNNYYYYYYYYFYY